MGGTVLLEVLRGGALTTVQDLGRAGFAGCGVPSGGAADPWAARAANRLVGNPDGAALLEITLAGPSLRVTAPAIAAWVGEPFAVSADGRPVPPGESFELAAGVVLDCGRARSGARAWLALAGGLDVPPVLGSRATELASGFGGLDGRALRAGDRLALGVAAARPPRRRLDPAFAAALAEPLVRVVPGPDDRLVPGGGAAMLDGNELTVTPQSDRRGVRLEGLRLAGAARGELRSQGVLPGAVELPASGEPIVLGVDAPVTGGYPWIAQGIAADLGRLARRAPGETLRFAVVDCAAAESARVARERALAEAIRAA